jgi:hypothetical protein
MSAISQQSPVRTTQTGGSARQEEPAFSTQVVSAAIGMHRAYYHGVQMGYAA